MRTFIVADTHFGHRNICQYSGRPWSDWEAMDTEMVRLWNETVGPNDTVYHLGDVAMGPEPESYLERLNGRLHLVSGNHDHRIKKHQRWESVSTRAVLDVDGVALHMRHHPWQANTEGGLYVHGHCHGTAGRAHQMGRDRLQHDVGVDCWSDRPEWSFRPIEAGALVRFLQAEEASFKTQN